MGPLFVLITWGIIGCALLCIHLILRRLSRSSALADRLSQVFPAFLAALAIPLGFLAALNLIYLLFFS